MSAALDVTRRDYASRELDRRVSEVNAASRGCSNFLFSQGGNFQQIGNWIESGYLTESEVRTALDRITSRQRRSSAWAAVRQGQRNGGARPWLPDSEFEAGRGSSRRSRPAEARREAVRAPPKDRERPVWSEFCRLLNSSLPLAEDVSGAGWLMSRGIAPEAVSLDDTPVLLAPEVSARFGWAGCGRRSWWSTGHRVLFVLWDPWGLPRSVVARCVRPGGPSKSLSPRGVARTGLVLANRAAVGALKDDEPTPWVLVVEGEPDWLTFAAALPGVAVIGVSPGAWRRAFAVSLNVDRIVVATDCNAAGDRMAEEIRQTWRNTVRARVDLLLKRRGLPVPAKCPDWNDCLRDGLFTLETAWDALGESLEVVP